MAKWVLSTPPPFTGTKHGVTVYQLPDQRWYVRMKSSIDGDRIKKDPIFKAFRKSSGRLKEASPIASFVYNQLRVKKYALYREMTGKAILWLKDGISAEAIRDRLCREYLKEEKQGVSIKKLPVKPAARRTRRVILKPERVKDCSIPGTYLEHTLDSLRPFKSG